ncbi:hypothetical protein ANN_19185, partial [Periplaneta americana]
MLIVFRDIQGVMRIEFMPKGTSINSVRVNHSSDGIKKLVTRWEKCMHRQSDYVEKYNY